MERPRCRHSSLTAAPSASAGSFMMRSFTSSTPTSSPFPRTSPICSWWCWSSRNQPLFLDDIDDRESDCRRKWVRDMGGDMHEPFAVAILLDRRGSQRGRDGDASTQRLGDRQNVRCDPLEDIIQVGVCRRNLLSVTDNYCNGVSLAQSSTHFPMVSLLG